MGNGEQYIWKPPEDDDVIFQHKQMGILGSHAGENMAASAAGVSVHLVFQTNPAMKSFTSQSMQSKSLESIKQSRNMSRALPLLTRSSCKPTHVYS